MIAWPSPSMIAAPAMSFFMLSMPEAGLRSSPPVSKHTPLPTSVTLGASCLAPDDVDQPRLPRAGAADGVDRRVVLGQQRVADDDPAARAGFPRDPLRLIRQFRRPHIGSRGRRQVAGEEHRAGQSLDEAAVGALGPRQLRCGRGLGLVAGEGVGAERPAERHPAGVAARRVALGQRVDPIAAFRQALRQPGDGPHRRLALARPRPAPGRACRSCPAPARSCRHRR